MWRRDLHARFIEAVLNVLVKNEIDELHVSWDISVCIEFMRYVEVVELRLQHKMPGAVHYVFGCMCCIDKQSMRGSPVSAPQTTAGAPSKT